MRQQNNVVLNYLKKNGGITALDAVKLGILRLSARIYDLKQMGVPIDGEIVVVKDRRGEACRVKKYFLERAVVDS
jgi:hypothetical protein